MVRLTRKMAAENNDIEESEQKVDLVQEKKNSEKKKKQPRGPTYMPKVIRKKIQGERMPVSINRRGQFVGHNGTELQSYLGVLARQNVPISFPSWPKVSRELKDKIWEQAQAVYDVDVKARKLALSSAGSKWRQFKYKLAKNWILPFKDNPEKLRKPPKEYNFISPKEWETFVAIRLSAKFEDEIIEKQKEGAISFSGGEDVLTAALGPEHSGYVRARGFGTTPTTYFNVPRRSTKDDIIKLLLENERKLREQERKGWEAKLAALEDEIRSLKAGHSSNQNAFGTPRHSFSAQNYCRDETSKGHAVNDDIIQVIGESNALKGKSCKLAVDDTGKVVALGTIIFSGDTERVVCGVKLGEDNYCVSVDMEVDGDAIIPFQIKSHPMLVKDALSQHVPWPKRLVYVNEKKVCKPIKGKLSLTKTNDVGDKMVPWTLELLKKHAETKMDCDKSIQGHLPEELFGERRTAFIFEDDIVKFCCMKQIGQTCIVLYMSYLYLELKKKNWGQMYGFIDPNRFSYNVGKPQARADTLANRMKDAIEDQIFLAPYNANSHWLLVAIDPFNNSAYFMDSMGRKAPNDVKDAVKLGLRLWNTERKVHSGTFKFQAPQQPGGVECGYYVMHFMKDIVEKHILSTSEKAFDTKTYSQEEIDELRNEWAVYVGSFL
ncbi:hypothetical protein UlMin_026321 [Ulmus minor]